MDIRLALMAGSDIPIPECKLILHQPSIKDISFMGEETFFKGVQTVSLYKSMFAQDKGVLDNVSNFQIFMTVINDKETADKKEAVQQLFLLTFPQYKIMFSPRSLIFQKESEMITIDESNFDFLQKAMRIIFCAKDGPMDQQAFNPANAKAKEIAEKLMKGRQRVAEQNGATNLSVFSQYLSILTIGLGSMSLQNLLNLTMYQLYDLFERYMLYTNWDIDIRARMAGAKIDKEPDNWMKNIH